MSKTTFVILFIIITTKTFCQNNEILRKIVTMSGKDTIEIKKFDNKGNLIFDKIFPQYGISQILAYKYLDNKLISYTWSHSNIGFVENEYVFDSIKNTKSTYYYDYNGNINITKLMSYNSVEELKNSEEFNKYKSESTRYLKSTQYFKDTILTKEIVYNVDGSINYTNYYTYEKGKLIRKKQVYASAYMNNELIYVYDENDNEIKWMKVYHCSDTAVVYTSSYKDNLLSELYAWKDGEISSKKYYKYLNGKLISEKQYDSKGVLKISSEFHYNQKGNIDYIDKVNKYLGQISRSKYYYE